MSQRNGEVSGEAMAFALVGAALIMMFIVLYAVACFVAIILTLVALCAWNEPLSLGKWTVTSEEARLFVLCGIIGLVAVPVFVVFCQLLFQFRVQAEWWPYILLGSYSFGALGLGAMTFEEEQQQEAAKFVALPPVASPPAFDRSQCPLLKGCYPPPVQKAEDEPPFRFASWDDEEAR